MDDAPVILVVDPDIPVIKMMKFLLEEAGFIALGAQSVSEAMEIIYNRTVELVFVEWTLPDGKGIDLCRSIKDYYGDIFTPVIMLTARLAIADKVEVLRGGADDYLIKPFEPAEVLARIDVMLRIRESFELTHINVRAPHSVEMRFEFPNAIKVACEQYLLYFVEFLKDIGIDVTASLHEEAGQVLFAVAPQDKEEALENILEALQVYLRFPASRTVTRMASAETAIEVQKLSAQVLSFQSQIMFANATIQQQQLNIQQQDMIIVNQQTLIQQQFLSGKVLIESLRETKQEEDIEPIVGDIVKAKKWTMEGVPIEVDLPEIIRWFKERFNRKRLP